MKMNYPIKGGGHGRRREQHSETSFVQTLNDSS